MKYVTISLPDTIDKAQSEIELKMDSGRTFFTLTIGFSFFNLFTNFGGVFLANLGSMYNFQKMQ